MASESTQVRVFLASPGGLEEERRLLRETISEFNDNYGHHAGLIFVSSGSERVNSGVGRPQSLINEEVQSADYLIAVIWDRWGSATSEEGTYSSGTQEELATAIECLGNVSAPMRDIAVYFKAVDLRQIGDAGPQLRRVIEFKQELETSRQIFFQTFDTHEELRGKFMNQLQSWFRKFSKKVPKQISIESLSSAASHTGPSATAPKSAAQHLDRARTFEEQGLVTRAEVAYARAVAVDERDSLLPYARFLRRTGRLQRALEINQRFLELDEQLTTDPISSATECATVLANMAVIRRKQGQIEESRRLLEEAIRTAKICKDDPALAAEAYALDNLGLTLRQLGDTDAALAQHREAFQLREQLKDAIGKAKVALNLGRILRENGRLDEANTLVSDAIVVLEDSQDELRTLANAYSTLGQIATAEANLVKARECFKECLRLNSEISHSDGIAIACGQLARLLLAEGAFDEARDWAERCLSVNEDSGNNMGIDIASQLLREIEDDAAC